MTTPRLRALRAGTLAALAALLLTAGCARRQSEQATPILRDPTADSRLNVARAAEASGQLDVALSMYGSAAAAEPGRPELQAAFAGALARAGNIGDAEEVLNRAIGNAPNDPLLLLQVGRLRLRTGAAPEALAQFDRILARDSRNAGALDGRGVALDLLGRHAEAQASYRAALLESPSSVNIANNLAMSLLLDGKAEEARAMLEPLARRSVAPPRVRTNLAVARAATGDAAGARALLGEGMGDVDLGAVAASLGRSGVALDPGRVPPITAASAR